MQRKIKIPSLLVKRNFGLVIKNLLVEEKLILAILTKIMFKDQLLIQDAMEQCTGSIKKLLTGNKVYLRKAVENAVAVLARSPKQGKEFFNELNKVKTISSSKLILIEQGTYRC